ncbi:MAG TPA: nuclear transport factor 2 family protein [Ktedonobacterales bacterium]
MTSPDDPLAVLHTFAKRLAEGDAEGASALFSEDARYEEPPRPPLVGREAIRAFIADFAARHSSAVFTVHRAIVDPSGSLLAAEWRWAYIREVDGATCSYEGIAFVELRGGRIASWRGFSALTPP